MNSKVEIIPNEIIDEYLKTMNLLFPSTDERTQKFLRERLKKQSFMNESPVDHPGKLYLSDFNVWRDQMANLYAEFSSPLPSMTQLFNDRRNVLQWYTFWFAVFIVVLTVIFGVISAVTNFMSMRYTYQQSVLARAAASPCNCSFAAPAAT